MIAFFNSLKLRTSASFSRKQNAMHVKKCAEDLLDTFALLECDEVANYYLHCAFHHLGDIIEVCPIEVDEASGCCIEHAHQPIKQALLRMFWRKLQLQQTPMSKCLVKR
jgi:hypothetical protein